MVAVELFCTACCYLRESCALVAAEEALLLKAIERLTGESLRRENVPGFEPTVLSAPPLDLSGGRGRRRPGQSSGNASRRRQDTRSTRAYRR